MDSGDVIAPSLGDVRGAHRSSNPRHADGFANNGVVIKLWRAVDSDGRRDDETASVDEVRSPAAPAAGVFDAVGTQPEHDNPNAVIHQLRDCAPAWWSRRLWKVTCRSSAGFSASRLDPGSREEYDISAARTMCARGTS